MQASLDPSLSPHLFLQLHRDVTLTPMQPSTVMPGFAVAAYGRGGGRLAAFDFRRNGSVGAAAAYHPAAIRKRGKYLYAGALVEHYGHFLLESLARFWAIREFGHLPFVWQVAKGQKHLARWQADILTLLGVDEARAMLVSRPTEFEDLVLPDAGIRLGEYLHPRQIETLAVFPFTQPRRGKRLWLSRARLPETFGRVLDEGAIEDRLRSVGWTILHPQDLPIREQLRTMSDAEVIGGFLGSAFHTLVLGRDIHAKVRIIDRMMRFGTETYEAIAGLKNIDQRIIHLPLTVADQGDRRVRWRAQLSDPADRERAVDLLNS